MKIENSKLKIEKGFSLVELLVVITIIAILSVVAYTAVGGQTIKARDAKRKQDLGTIQQALELYFAEKGTYPTSPLTSGTGAGQIPKQKLSEIPVDPGPGAQPYIYAVSGTEYELAATLENDGQIPNYEGYVVGNADNRQAKTIDGRGRYNNGGTLTPCSNTHNIVDGQIGTSDAPDNCVPYDPNVTP